MGSLSGKISRWKDVLDRWMGMFEGHKKERQRETGKDRN